MTVFETMKDRYSIGKMAKQHPMREQVEQILEAAAHAPNHHTNYKHVVEDLPLDLREWTYPECNTWHDRDINAAKAKGLLVSACGGSVRPGRAKARWVTAKEAGKSRS